VDGLFDFQVGEEVFLNFLDFQGLLRRRCNGLLIPFALLISGHKSQ
jgi:hypothetical protein